MLFIFLIVFSCNNGTQTASTERSTNPSHDPKVTIKYGQETAVVGKDISVRFTAILEDSRCPEGVQCIWEGNARIELAIAKAVENPSSLELNTHDRFPIEAMYLNYIITLIDLKPYPKATEQINMQDYTAIVEIRKR